MSRLHLDAATIERQVSDLLASYPELADDEALKADAIEGETDATAFLSRVARAIRSEEAMADAIKDAAKAVAVDFGKRHAAAEKRAEGLRALAYRILTAAKPNGPVRLPEATMSLAAVPSRLVIEDEADIPDGFFKHEMVRKLDRDALKQFVDGGKTVAGTKMSDPSTRLNVRWV